MSITEWEGLLDLNLGFTLRVSLMQTGRTPLHYASVNRHEKLVVLLMNRNGNINMVKYYNYIVYSNRILYHKHAV